MIHVFTRRFVMFLTSLLVAGSLGCTPSPFGVAGEDVVLPPTAKFVSDHAAQFVSFEPHPLASKPSGTVIDDLHALDGCWASVLAEEGKAIALFSIYRFDAATGTVEAQS